MGLDMYLTAEKGFYPYFGDDKEKNRKSFSKLLSGAEITAQEIDSEFPTADVSFKVGYWRKANAIHAWFVENVQDGEDNCASYDVSKEKLIELKNACVTVLADISKAEELLPPEEGFFFGSTEIDEMYLSDLKRTIEIINRCFRERLDTWNFKYQSSW